MDVTGPLLVVEDPRFLEHRAPPGHPERPERLAAVESALAGRADRVQRRAAREADDEDLLRVHPREHLARLSEAVRQAPVHLDPDTYVSPRSLEVARLAAGSAIEVARAVATGQARAGLAAVRPPGHHAEAARAMGFCLLNNVAVAARALQRTEGLERLLIIDWDVHHGNGTQHVFEEDPSVVYFSTHQFPFYPGTGDFGEVGRGRGRGATVNVPLPAGCGDAEYLGVFQRVLVPVALDFRPELLLISCGFDAHRDDPLGGMQVTGAGFLALARVVRALADELCGGRTACVLEGGYAPSGLAEGTAAVLDALHEPDPPPIGPAPPIEPGGVLGQVLRRVVEAHGADHPGLGSA